MARKCRDLFSRPEKEKIPRGVSKINGPQGVLRDPSKGYYESLPERKTFWYAFTKDQHSTLKTE